MVAKRQLMKRWAEVNEISFERLYEEFILSKRGQIAPHD
jgi:hypothetical protein